MVLIHDPAVVELLAYAGLDVAIIDGEHAPLDGRVCAHLVRAAECSGILPLFRYGLNNIDEVLPLLDTGMMGIMVPHVNTRQRAEMAVQAVKYAPVGARGMTPGRASRYRAVGISAREQIETTNRDTLVLVQIEEMEAVENLDEILTVEGVDVFVIGPGDLSQSMGYAGDRTHPEVLAMIDRIIERVTATGKVVGISAGSRSAAEWLERRVQFPIWGDASMLLSAARKIVAGKQGRVA
jgi:4-hydroxy-2-oxoheptanedioate aldolase